MRTSATASVRHLLPVLLLAATTAVMITPADAAVSHRTPGKQDRGRPIVLASEEMSLDAAVAMVRQRFGGKVISARTTGEGDRKVHVIKVLSSEGRVTTVRVDAASGRIH